MTFERNPAPPPEPSPTPMVGTATPREPSPVQIRLQILSTEHWSLLASRSLAWNETFSRAGMYLSTLSAAMVALGLIAGVSGFGDEFFAFAFVILPVALFVGIGTWLRMGASNYHDAMTVFGMNRIRGAYLEIAPDLEPYFVMGVHDDAVGIGQTMGLPPGTPALAHLGASTPFLVVVLNAVVAGAIAALTLIRFAGADTIRTILGGLIAATIALVAQMVLARRNIQRGQAAVRPMFPTPGASQDPGRIYGPGLADRSGPAGDVPADRPGA